MIDPNNLRQAVALQQGWDGSGQGEGGHKDWVANLDPGAASQYQTSINAIENPGTMPALVEPLHEWEREGLSTIAGGTDTSGVSSASNQLMNMMGKYGDRAYGEVMDGSEMINKGTAATTLEEIMGVANPYASNLKSNLSADAEKLRAQATSQQGLRGGRSFGDTSTGARMGAIDDSELRGYGDIDYKTFETAMGQINEERDRYLSGASGKQSGANVLNSSVSTMMPGYNSNIANAKYLAETDMSDASKRVDSGQYVRKYNQGVNDIISADVAGAENAEMDSLSQIMDLLSNFQSGTSSGQTGGMQNDTAQYGGLAQSVAGALPTLFPTTFG